MEELLGLQGGSKKRPSDGPQKRQSKKKRTVASDSDSSESEQEEASSSEDDGLEEEEAAPRSRLQRTRANEPEDESSQSESESEDEIDMYDDEGYGDEEDRQRLDEMNEIEREQTLAARVDAKRKRLQQRQLREKIRAKKKGPPKKPQREPRARHSRNNERENKKAALEDLRRRKSHAGAKKKQIQAYEEEESEEESDEKDDPSDFDSSEDEGYDRFETQKEFEELDWEDLKKMIPDLVLKRQTLEQWHNKPYFDTALQGCFVRVNIGASRTDNTAQYRLCRVDGVKHTPKQYKLSTGKGIWCKKLLTLSWGSDKKSFPITVTSNEAPDEKLMERWREKCLKDNLDLPNKEEVDRIQEQLENARNFVYDDSVIDKIVAGGDVTKQGNIVIRKERLMWLIKSASKDGDQDLHEKYSQELEELLQHEDNLKQDVGQYEKLASGMTHINQKHREKNRAIEAAAGRKNMKSREMMEDDFIRRPTKLQEYFDLGSSAKPGTPRAPATATTKAKEAHVSKKSAVDKMAELKLQVDHGNLDKTQPRLQSRRTLVQPIADKKHYLKTISLGAYYDRLQ